MKILASVCMLVALTATAIAEDKRPILTEAQCESLFWQYQTISIKIDEIGPCSTAQCLKVKSRANELLGRVESLYLDGGCEEYAPSPRPDRRTPW